MQRRAYTSEEIVQLVKMQGCQPSKPPSRVSNILNGLASVCQLDCPKKKEEVDLDCCQVLGFRLGRRLRAARNTALLEHVFEIQKS